MDTMLRGPAKKKAEVTSSQRLESNLWATADKLRGHLDAADYKHVVLGLIFLKYISDRFAQRHAEILAEGPGPDPEDRDEYTAEGVFWVPASARWSEVQAAAKQTDIGKRIDDAMTEIERENPKLKGILPKGYARPTLDQRRLGELVDLIGTIGLGTAEHQARDTLGRVYEYFLGMFASAEGKRGGEFYTPASVVRTLVAMLAPYKGRIYDPCCGSGGMFVQSEKFIEAHGGKVGDISVYGEESNPNTWKLALMNLAIRGIEADLGLESGQHLSPGRPRGVGRRFRRRAKVRRQERLGRGRKNSDPGGRREPRQKGGFHCHGSDPIGIRGAYSPVCQAPPASTADHPHGWPRGAAGSGRDPAT